MVLLLLLLVDGCGGESLDGGSGGPAPGLRGASGIAVLMAGALLDCCGCGGPDVRPRA